MSGAPSPLERVRGLLWGFRPSCVLVAAVEVGLVARLADGPLAERDLARALALEPQALARFLRVLAALEVVEREPDGRLALTAAGRALDDLRDFALLIGAEYMPAWDRLAESLRTGRPAFEAVFGMSVWEHRLAHPALGEALQRTLEVYHRGQMDAVLEAVDLSDLGVLVDVGGGSGSTAIQILRRYPAARAIVFDQPAVVGAAASRLAAAGLAERARVVAGSFLDEVPPGGDVYVLKHVLHNWDDATSQRVLAACRRAMAPASRLLVIERVVPDGPAPLGAPDGHWDLGLIDLHMLAVLGGRERTLAEYDRLLGGAGLARARCIDAAGAIQVLEARAGA